MSAEHERLADRVDRVVALHRWVMEHPALDVELEFTVANRECSGVEHRSDERGALQGAEQFGQPIPAGGRLLESLSEREIAHAGGRLLDDRGRLTAEEVDDRRDREVVLSAVGE